MNLFGRDFSPEKVINRIKSELSTRGIVSFENGDAPHYGAEGRVEPFAFILEALSDNVDPTQGQPIQTHRGGLSGRVVTGAKRLFRATFQGFINESLSRQRTFNGHVRDGYAMLSAEVTRLKNRVETLEQELSEARAGNLPPPVVKSAPRAPAASAPKAPAKQASVKSRVKAIVKAVAIPVKKAARQVKASPPAKAVKSAVRASARSKPLKNHTTSRRHS